MCVVHYSTAMVIASEFSSNNATYGGAQYVASSSIMVNESTLESNAADVRNYYFRFLIELFMTSLWFLFLIWLC